MVLKASGNKSGDISQIERLIAIGIALSSEKNVPRLLEMILDEAISITQADGGTLYTVIGEKLQFEVMRSNSLGLAMGGESGESIPFYPIALYNADGSPNNAMVAAHAALTRQTVNIEDAYAEEGFDFSGTRAFDRKTGYRSTSFLTIPMRNHENDVIGVLQLINKLDQPRGVVVAFTQHDQRMSESLASQAALALSNRRLIDDLGNLFESFIKMIASAIDEKSPHTAAHCERVPALTMMLADAANRIEHGPLKDFSMSEQDRYALEVASWLHDCGKITTPEYIIDKSSKLETVYDRIHTIDTRFEVLKRDAEIRRLNSLLELQGESDGDQVASIERNYRDEIRLIDEDRDFLRRCNVGSEHMASEDQERVRHIAARTWMNAEGAMAPLLEENEVYNLTIPKGSLTPEERQIINNHMATTIKMLESLPFPKHLRNVPEFAGGHHEKMDGSGYPKGLTRSQMSVPARVMAIADIFEALTAMERPYKDGMKLSEALGILGRMKQKSHIDPDLFDVFLHEQVFLIYAQQYMEPDQIDIDDPEDIPGYPFD